MVNRTITAIYETRGGGKFATGFNSMRSAEEWRKLINDCNPGWITEWSIDTAPYEYPEVFHVLRESFQ
jgi:hypothetical protein